MIREEEILKQRVELRSVPVGEKLESRADVSYPLQAEKDKQDALPAKTVTVFVVSSYKEDYIRLGQILDRSD